jgi:hypothetical protein
MSQWKSGRVQSDKIRGHYQLIEGHQWERRRVRHNEAIVSWSLEAEHINREGGWVSQIEIEKQNQTGRDDNDDIAQRDDSDEEFEVGIRWVDGRHQ